MKIYTFILDGKSHCFKEVNSPEIYKFTLFKIPMDILGTLTN